MTAVGLAFRGWFSFDGTGLAALLTAVAGLITAVAAYRRAGRRGTQKGDTDD